MNTREWTDDRKATLRRLWNQGVQSPEIAEAMGISRSAVMGQVFRLGLASRTLKPREAAVYKSSFWTPARVEHLQALWADGTFSLGDISRQLGCSKNAIASKAHRLGLEAKPSPIVKRAPGVAPKLPKPRAVGRVTLAPLTSETSAGTAEMQRPPRVGPSVPAFGSVRPNSRSRTCIHTEGVRRAWILCDEPADVGSPFCARHRATCAVAVHHVAARDRAEA